MTGRKYYKLGIYTALMSFLIGTIIFLFYYFTSDSSMLFVGYMYILMAVLLNLAVLISIAIKSKRDLKNRFLLKKAMIYMAFNIPVMLIYCWFAIVLLNTMRITFTNKTGSDLTDLKIEGCGGGEIASLKINESKTIWIDIPGDCDISISYVKDGQRVSETVAGYLSSSMGHKAKHEIDGNDKDII